MQEALAATTGTPSGVEQIVAQPEAMTESADGQSDAESQAMTMEPDNEDYHNVAEPCVEAAESAEVQSKNEVEVLPPSQPDGGQAIAESLVERGDAKQAGIKPSSTDPSDCEAEQAVEPSIANKPDGV